MSLYKCKNCNMIYKFEGQHPICPKCESTLFQTADDIKKLKQEKVKERIKKRLKIKKVEIVRSNPSIIRDKSKCINCGQCAEVCAKQGIFGSYTRLSTPVCVNCGKCTLTCPTYALCEKLSFRKVRDLIGKNTVVVSIAPAVKVSFEEEFNFKFSEKQLVTALKKLGFDYVFDICYGADVTIMEEAKELIERIENHKLPMFTSCCPSWVKYAEIYAPEILPSISTTKSPISMQSALVKTYFKERLNKDVIHVVIAPCTAKKFEITRKELTPTTDYILTTRELALFMKVQGIDINSCEESDYDYPFDRSSKSGNSFANSGGVSSSVLKTAYYLYNNKPANEEDFNVLINKQENTISTVNFGKTKLKVMKVYGLKQAKDVLTKIRNKSIEVDFVEVMACENGCVGGGGQPRKQENVSKRFDNLQIRNDIIIVKEAYNNISIQDLYSKLKCKSPDEIKALFHTKYKSREREYMLKKEKIMELKNSKTEQNLMEAFAGESQARNKYTFYASQAKKDGYEEIASIFEETANNEKEHAKLWFKALHNGMPQTLENLLDAAAGEYAEWTDMYKRMAEEARSEGFTKIAEQFEGVAAIEKGHEERFRKLAEQVKANKVFESEDVVVWKCRNCGHIHVGTKAPEVCPVCFHAQGYFEIVK